MSTPETPASQGKGRPTPKRKDAQRQRPVSMPAPRTRREALARARELRKEQSVSNRSATRSANVRELPARERTPERILARDFVDSRRNLGIFFMPIVILYFLSSFTGANSALARGLGSMLFAGLALLVFDSVRIGRGLSKLMRERIPDSRARNPWFYAASRTIMPRRWRMPKPRVGVGDEIPR